MNVCDNKLSIERVCDLSIFTLEGNKDGMGNRRGIFEYCMNFIIINSLVMTDDDDGNDMTDFTTISKSWRKSF